MQNASIAVLRFKLDTGLFWTAMDQTYGAVQVGQALAPIDNTGQGKIQPFATPEGFTVAKALTGFGPGVAGGLVLLVARGYGTIGSGVGKILGVITAGIGGPESPAYPVMAFGSAEK